MWSLAMAVWAGYKALKSPPGNRNRYRDGGYAIAIYWDGRN